MAIPITITCECGRAIQTDLGERVVCACGRAYDTSQVPREKRAAVRSKRAEEAKRAMEEAEAQQGVEHPADHAEGADKVKENKE